jgi:hypothetical protein
LWIVYPSCYTARSAAAPIARILWDIYDDEFDGNDTISAGVRTLFQFLADEGVQRLDDLWDRWVIRCLDPGWEYDAAATDDWARGEFSSLDQLVGRLTAENAHAVFALASASFRLTSICRGIRGSRENLAKAGGGFCSFLHWG